MQGAPCEEEQRRFLEWLVDTIVEQEVEVLVVAGDIFHRDQPPARALSLYYQFLARCAAMTELQQIVIVGGNHDSPTRLDAPAEVLSALDVHVVGGLMVEEETWGRCLCPVVDPESDEVEAVVVAVPYVQEAKLGIVTTSASESEIRRQYTERFAHLYGTLADMAEERFPGVPLIATGHLTVETKSAQVNKGDFHEEIHQVGTISGLSPSIFGERYDYVALGHIHRMFPIGPMVRSGEMFATAKSHAWYSGTPVATSQTEASTRYVLVADTEQREDDGALVVDKVEVPCWREILPLKGSQEDISEAILALPKEPELVPYVFIDVEIDSADQMYEVRDHFDQLIKDNFSEGFRPRIVERREHLRDPVGARQGSEGGEELPSLEDLSPEDVFKRLFADAHGGHKPRDEYLVAFRYLVQTATSNDYSAEDAPELGAFDDDGDDSEATSAEDATVEDVVGEDAVDEDVVGEQEPATAGEAI
jgi:exonuclease SbcD